MFIVRILVTAFIKGTQLQPLKIWIFSYFINIVSGKIIIIIIK